MDRSIFAELDPWVILYAAGMAMIASLVTTYRTRNAQRLRGQPLSPWATILPDVITGMLVGTFGALLVPRWWHVLNNFTGVSILAGGGGIIGPALWDLFSRAGLNALLTALSNTAAGPLARYLAQQQKDGAKDDQQSPPPPAS